MTTRNFQYRSLDRLQVLIAYPPKLAVSVIVNNLKSVSSRLLRQQC
ncbi:hypothetical protein HHJ84_04270 [Photorhabdus heterorhabditis subsp. aluminescens]|nr:hypothetical protein [Photorhabdus heterorhabditis subsp. aluminescens]